MSESRDRRTAQTEQRSAAGRRAERGQSILEAAVLVPILLLLLALVIDAARAFDAQIVLTNAVREGARYASLDPKPDPTQIRNLVRADVVGSGTNVTHMADFAIDDVEMTVVTETVTVTVHYDFPLWFGGMVGLDQLTLEKSAVMPRAEGLKEQD